jgi:hypothetical protein
MNSSTAAKVPSSVIAKSSEEVEPIALLSTATRIISQALEGLASGNLASSNGYAKYIGEDVTTVRRSLLADQSNLEITTEEVDWPLEIWTLQQMLQRFVVPGKNILIYHTSRDIVVGFGIPPASGPR